MSIFASVCVCDCTCVFLDICVFVLASQACTHTHTHTHTQLETHKDRPRESAGRLVPGGVALSKSQRLDYDEAFFSVVVDKFGGGIGRTWGLLAGDVGDPAKGLRENSGRNFFNVL